MSHALSARTPATRPPGRVWDRAAGLIEKMVLPMTLPTTGLTLRSSDGVGIFRRASHPARLLGVAAAAFAVLVATGIALRPGQDLGLARALNGLHTGPLGVVASATYNVFEPVPSVVLTAALAAVIWIVKDLRTGAAFAGCRRPHLDPFGDDQADRPSWPTGRAPDAISVPARSDSRVLP